MCFIDLRWAEPCVYLFSSSKKMETDSWDDANEWHPDYFECEPSMIPNNPALYADNDFPSWSSPHLAQLEHFWGLCRAYCRDNHLPLLDDDNGVTFAAFCRSLSPLNTAWRASQARYNSVTAPLRAMETD